MRMNIAKIKYTLKTLKSPKGKNWEKDANEWSGVQHVM